MEPSNDSQMSHRNTQTEMMITRQAQEVQVAMLSAKRFPRDELYAMERIKKTCQRATLAEQAIYSYPKGGQNVSGPSIRLAEAIAQNWGNIDTGIIELENRDGKSEMMAYAWDLETNTRVTKTFSVEHKRDTKQGSKQLTDVRDVYEATANFGSRRVRACILSVVPGDVVDLAVKECRKTLADKDQRPVAEILKEMLKAFKNIGVSQAMLEKYMDKKAADLLKEDLVDLRGIYKAINDGQSKITDYFKEAVDTKVNASDNKKSAIINANRGPVPDNVNPETGEVTEDTPPTGTPDDAAQKNEAPTPPAGSTDPERSPDGKKAPKKSVKEMAAERGWNKGGKQSTLIDEDDNTAPEQE